MGETDHSSYAILYYQKGRSVSVKLYGVWVGARGLTAEEGQGWQSGGDLAGLRGLRPQPHRTQTQEWGLPKGPSPQMEDCPQMLQGGAGKGGTSNQPL